MKKYLKVLILAALLVTISAACSKPVKETEPNENQSIRETGTEDSQEPAIEVVTLQLSVPDGIPALTMTKMIKENTQISDNLILEYTTEKTTDSLAAKVLSGSADIAIVPSNLAAQLYNKELGYQIAATGSWGSFYLISEEDIKDLNDLKGKAITTIGKGLTPDLMLRHILNMRGIVPDEDVEINYLNGATELAPNFISGKAAIASVPEPMLSTILSKKTDAHIFLDFNKEWKDAYNSEHGFPQSSLIIKKEILDKYQSEISLFLKEYENSVLWANDNPEKLGEYAGDLELAINPEVLAKALTRANIKYVPIQESIKDYSEFFKVLSEIEPKTIGGQIPDEGIYFK